MIRKLLFFIALLGFAALFGYFVLSGESSKNAVTEGAQNARWAAEQLVPQTEGMEIRFVSVGLHADEGKWRFRGMISRAAATTPAHGVIELTCQRPRREADCWRIAELVVDGRPLLDQNTARTRGITSSEPTQPTANTPTPSDPAPAQAAAAPAPAPEPEPVIEKWRTSREVVNARQGPGTAHPIVTRITPGHLLTLVSKEAGWGQFEIIEPEQLQGQIVWIWLDLIQQVDG